ncbi:MAG TPA: hypothetical protein VE572_01135 [Nitrososphaeraceae archaeon]|nr:hypothetical protein [Nitrososphaeraceae archaeon]
MPAAFSRPGAALLVKAQNQIVRRRTKNNRNHANQESSKTCQAMSATSVVPQEQNGSHSAKEKLTVHSSDHSS